MEGSGRKSADSLAVVAVGLAQRPEPPEALVGAGADLWRAIAATKPPEWFRADTFPLLEAYCRAVVEYRRQVECLAGFVPTDKEYVTLCKLVKEQAALMLSLATRMRLTQQSRYAPSVAANADRKASPDKPWLKRL